MKRFLIILTLLLFSSFTQADILVFVHGFDSDSLTWRKKGIIGQLQMAGWQDAGNIIMAPNGMILYQKPLQLQPFRMVTVDLPSTAPIPVQGNILARYLYYLAAQDKDQTFTLIGHSAGGIVARFVMVSNPQLKINKLITIASPHRGSGMAEAMELASKMFMGDMFDMMGDDTLKDSEDLMNQLQRDDPGTFLFWLNHQPHPPAKYYSIIRTATKFSRKDFIVPKERQDMRLIPTIPNALSFGSYGKHQLNPRDAALIISLVNPVGQYY